MNSLNELIELKKYVNSLIENVLSEELSVDTNSMLFRTMSQERQQKILSDINSANIREQNKRIQDEIDKQNSLDKLRQYDSQLHSQQNNTPSSGSSGASSRAAGRLLVRGGILAGIIGVKTAASMYASHRKKKSWKENGCSKLDAEEKIQCREYLKSIKGK